MKERVQKVLCKNVVCSRKKEETLLREKRIQVNGKIAFIGEKADLENDTIKVVNQAFQRKLI